MGYPWEVVVRSVFREKIQEYVIKHQLVSRGDLVLLAVSGGPDSMALMDAFSHLAPDLEVGLHVVHLNHGFRGEEGARDGEFVRREAERRGLPATVLSFDVPAYRDRHRMSPQDAARRIRYSLFLEVAKKVGARRLAVAHHRDDQVETILINILRGAGPGGLRGMKPLRRWRQGDGLFVIRPLLQVSREEIERYLEVENVPSRLDRSNLKETYLRNKVRLFLLPLLEEEFNPAIRDSLLSLGAIMGDLEEYLEDQVSSAWQRVFLARRGNRVILDRSALLAEPKALRGMLVRRALRSFLPGLPGITRGHVERLLELASGGETGASLNLPGGVKARTSYRELHLQAGDSQADSKKILEPLVLPLPGAVHLPWEGQRISASLLSREEMPWPPQDDREAFLDYDRLPHGVQLSVRNRREGDRFRPLGLGGSKKLKDFLIDKKVPREERDRLPLVTGGGEVLWVAGLAIHEGYKITRGTRRVLHLVLEKTGDLARGGQAGKGGRNDEEREWGSPVDGG